ncbi:hypothetical protein GJV85_02760 [Sulfurimonas aquatica]|uniref:Uncharacterized protein n=1 Tax=Sulfurimonas aquatica TaxID=2672570 RepID=A0A975AYY7_9BACT|nr:hypothetical protein [Sulfurimonas aquatica]QSZ41080.1 hypothetical protein GJV85_02760 [Sulfurimonas aquatica]
MKKHISVLYGLVLVGNISLALIIVTKVQSSTNTLQSESKLTFENKIKEHLVSKGLTATNLPIQIHNSDEEINQAVMLLSSQFNVNEQRFIEVLSNRILQKKSIDIKNTDNLIAIAQVCNGGYISSETLQLIHEFTNIKNEVILV